MGPAAMPWYACTLSSPPTHCHGMRAHSPLPQHTVHSFTSLQCGRAMQPNFLFGWPHARMGVAQPEHILEAQQTQVQVWLAPVYQATHFSGG